MVEVYKTNVKNQGQAEILLSQIYKAFPGCKANFDLEDCDKILRVESSSGFVQPFLLTNFLKDLGCDAEVLPDIIHAIG